MAMNRLTRAQAEAHLEHAETEAARLRGVQKDNTDADGCVNPKGTGAQFEPIGLETLAADLGRALGG